MATFTPEDGTGLDNSNSFITTAYLVDYLSLRGIVCCDTQLLQEQNAVLGTDYIETVYGQSFKGEKLYVTQALSFPRVIDGETVYPDALLKATCELTIRSANSDDPLLADSDKRVIEEKLDVMQVKYDTHSDEATRYNSVYNLLQPYLLDATGQFSHTVIRT